MSKLNILLEELAKFHLFLDVTSIQLSCTQRGTYLRFTMTSGCTSDYNTASASSLGNVHLYTLYKLNTLH